jgi:hypothetical protein
MKKLRFDDERSLGRFDHHPDPAIDFCIEVDCIEGIAFDVAHQLESRELLVQRLTRALDFKVGGDQNAVAAKQRLRVLAQQLEGDK